MGKIKFSSYKFLIYPTEELTDFYKFDLNSGLKKQIF